MKFYLTLPPPIPPSTHLKVWEGIIGSTLFNKAKPKANIWQVFLSSKSVAHENISASRSRFNGIFNFLLDDEYPEVQERSDFRYSRKGKIENYLNIQARYMRLCT